ncbi:MAG TPA: glycosyltransferase family 39 protein [Candidatus Paceibacterota bacterium]|nr:glycosyltransferase family 39 protein [Verrucomicrobiota bacterium]HRZ43912.1 glycosyltransferase family 39 protein [Candidatus Paceibacterota bacterium]HRZ91652.1 glycosyltransferase family 39 protein [Candidatus Paceibacterota bacterium]
MLPGIQNWIYKLEEGASVRWIKRITLFLAILGGVVFYDLREYRQFTAPEAMDTAQLARNLAEGRGFTTLFVRPLSLHLVQSHLQRPDALLRDGHPDLAHPPLYPLMLAALMKAAPMPAAVPPDRKFDRYPGDFRIAWFNQFWFLAGVALVFRLGRKLFNPSVAWLAAGLMLGSDVFWRFSVSGLSTSFLVALFLVLALALVRVERAEREEDRGAGWFFCRAIWVGLLLGLGALTRYSFAWLAAPVALFFFWFAPRRRGLLIPVALLVMGLLWTPWLYRNYRLSGALFGTAGYALYMDTASYPGTTLERSVHPDPAKINLFSIDDQLRKLTTNGQRVIQDSLPRLGGNWITAFFLAGLLVPFRQVAASRIRLFVVCCLPLMALVQAMGRTYLSQWTPDINSENFLVIAAPVVFVLGAGMFHWLLERLQMPFPPLRRWVVVGAGLVFCAPLWLTLLPPRQSHMAYPPYYPWLIQQMTGLMRPDELMMSDMPWATAWYGNRQCLWLTVNPDQDFYAINDFQKPVKGLMLGPVILEQPFLSQLIKGDERAWGQFILRTAVQGRIPPGFPLRHVWTKLLPDYLFLADFERWSGLDRQ